MSKTISGTYASGITLTSIADNPTTITALGRVNAGLYISNPAAWQVVNQGSIHSGSGGKGITLSSGGTVTNQTAGGIYGIAMGIYGAAGGALTVVNAGKISASAGIYLRSGGVVTNQSTGTISGSDAIISYANTTVVNAGRLLGGSTNGLGIDFFNGGGSVTNQSTGTISGGSAIYGQTGGALTVVNAGQIAGITTSSNGMGVFLQAGGIVTNQAGGTISGYDAIVGANFGAATVSNAGTITGTRNALKFGTQQDNRLIVSAGAKFTGTVNGGNLPGAVNISTLELTSSASTGTLTGLGAQFVNFGSIKLDTGAHWFLEGGTAGLAGTIAGFAAGDTIKVDGITATGSSFSAGVLTLNVGGGTVGVNVPGNFTTGNFTVTNVAGGTNITVACFREGTLIGTPAGDVAVEALRPGDHVTTVIDGPSAPIVWVGHRTLDCTRHPRPEQVWPIRVAAGAFADGVPARDLFLSPDHAIYVEGALIPAKHLVNGTSVAQIPVNRVTYFHVELAEHDVILAEGLPAESYLDSANRGMFAHGGGSLILHPDMSPAVGRPLNAPGLPVVPAPAVTTGSGTTGAGTHPAAKWPVRSAARG